MEYLWSSEFGADGLRCPTRDGMHFTAPDSELHNFTMIF